MQEIRTQNKIKETFENPFEEARFRDFVRNLLNHIEEEDNHPYSGQFIATAFQPYISTLKRIGKYSDGEHEMDVLIVQLKKVTSLERARTAQRNFIARYLNGSRGGKMKDAALVAFVSPNEMDWRFSLIKMDYKFIEGKNGKIKVKEEFTPARRWSFLVGPNEHSHTAQARLAPVIEDENVVTLARLEEAFNIEKVTKEFFEKYRNLFADTKEALDKILVSNNSVRNDFTDKSVSSIDFSKRLLGQIVFLYFLQKKGWFGVPKDKKWGDGDKNFLRSLYKGEYLKYKNFYNDILEPLFYDALALDRSHLDHWNEHFQCKIPFLNGGLFDNKYNWHETEIELPNDLFSNDYLTKEKDKGTGILDIFDRYNFTVKEDEPLEKEVAVDPEMLGKVFENLLEVKDRKSKGTYYTPREIVHYMCEQSLVSYLATELQGKVSKEDIEKLIKIGENVVEHEAVSISKENNPEYGGDYKRLLPDTIKDFANEIDDKLATIKVCDPAIGSGAFPVGMMNAIVKARMVLSSYLKDKNRTLYAFKRDCIQNSLYGVDIDPGAVEIAKLRLWLSLVVDEDNIKQIKPLPNLDYKIMQGNSLLEEFEGIKLFDEKLIAVIDTGKEKQLELLKQKQVTLQKEYFELHSQNKLTKALQAELNSELQKITRQIKQLAELNIQESKQGSFDDLKSEAKKKADDLKRLHKEFFEATQKSKKDNIKRQIEQLEWELIEATLKEQGKTSALKKLEEFRRSNTKPFFLWRLNFADVFEEKGGFDVVIANPPYNAELSDDERKYFKEKYKSVRTGRQDTAAIFVELSERIGSADFQFSYILPYRLFSRVRNHGEFQKYILSNFALKDIIYLGTDVDFTANDEFMVLIMAKGESVQENIVKVGLKPSLENLSEKSFLTISQSKFLELGEINLNLLRFDPSILSKIKASSAPLIQICDVKDGIVPYIREKLISRTKKDERYVPFAGIAGQYILQKYYFEHENLWLCYDINEAKKFIKNRDELRKVQLRDRSIFEHRKIITSQNSSILKGTIDEEALYVSNSIHSTYLKEEFTDLFSLEYVLALINSKLINYFHNSLRTKGTDLHPQILVGDLKKLPIKEITKTKQKPFIDFVERIIKITKTDDYLKDAERQAKVHDLEHQIDKLVYKLYELTPEEIKIVESN